MSKFRVGDKPNTVFEIYNHRVAGGTWYSEGDVGISERRLRTEFPFLEWDSPPSPENNPLIPIKSESIPKIKETIKENKMSKNKPKK